MPLPSVTRTQPDRNGDPTFTSIGDLLGNHAGAQILRHDLQFGDQRALLVRIGVLGVRSELQLDTAFARTFAIELIKACDFREAMYPAQQVAA